MIYHNYSLLWLFLVIAALYFIFGATNRTWVEGPYNTKVWYIIIGLIILATIL